MSARKPRFTQDAFLAIVEHASTNFDPESPEVPRTLTGWAVEFARGLVNAAAECGHLSTDETTEDGE